MMKFVADENFNNDILRGLSRRHTTLDVIRVQDTELESAEDPLVLEWAAQTGRILLTHDIRTMPNYAYERLHVGKVVSGVFVVHDDAPIGRIIEDLLTIIEASEPIEWENRVVYLPLK